MFKSRTATMAATALAAMGSIGSPFKGVYPHYNPKRRRRPTFQPRPITVPPLTEGQRHRLMARLEKFQGKPPRHLAERASL